MHHPPTCINIESFHASDRMCTKQSPCLLGFQMKCNNQPDVPTGIMRCLLGLCALDDSIEFFYPSFRSIEHTIHSLVCMCKV